MNTTEDQSDEISERDTMSAPIIDEITNAFLRCPLPESVCADQCATKPQPGRTGTNLLSFTEAREVLWAVLAPHLRREITEADVASFLKSAHVSSELPAWAAIQCSAQGKEYGFCEAIRASFSVFGHTPGSDSTFVHGSGDTIKSAVAAFIANCGPTGAELAAKKRAAAAKLLAEADALAPAAQDHSTKAAA